VDDAERAIVEIDRHREAVVGVELVVADAVAFGLVEGLEAAEDVLDLQPRAIGGEIEDVDADVAQRAVRAVLLGEPPEPARIGPPVAPGFADEPAGPPSAPPGCSVWR
jgi:hypothetical protein